MSDSDKSLPTVHKRVPPRSRRWRSFGAVGSVAICLAVSLCLLIQPDWLTPVVLVPTWCWLIPGLTLAICSGWRNHKLRFVAALALWCVFVVLFVEEARSLIRVKSWPKVERQTLSDGGRTIRVVSLNCNVGQLRSAEEVAAWNPDLVLLQESPSNESLGRLSQTLFGAKGEFLHGGDVSILARGKIHAKFSDQASHFVHAEVEFPNGFKADVISLRLAPPVFRLDFWMPGFWIEHRNRRIEHREQVLDIMQHVKPLPTSGHLIVGGDFNSPPRDDALAPLQQRLFDSFRKAGHGWGATGTNDHPLFRVDQIWVSEGFQAESVTAEKTSFSDHRMVVCDLTVELGLD